MSTLTIPARRLLADVRPGDKITAVGTHALPVAREVAAVLSDRVRMVNALGTATEWNLYPGNVEQITVDRADPKRKREPGTYTIRRTRFGLPLFKHTTVHAEDYLSDTETWWQTADGQYEIGVAMELSFCDGPHPVRERTFDRDGRRLPGLFHGYCEGGQEHDRDCGWSITVTRGMVPSEIDDVYPTMGQAWERLAAYLAREDKA